MCENDFEIIDIQLPANMHGILPVLNITAGTGTDEDLKANLTESLLDSNNEADVQNSLTGTDEDLKANLTESLRDSHNEAHVQNSQNVENNNSSCSELRENCSIINAEEENFNSILIKSDSISSSVQSENETTEENENLLPEHGACFYHLSYLGASVVNLPKSEVEIQSHMASLNEQIKTGQEIEVSVHISNKLDEPICVYEANTTRKIVLFEVSHIAYCSYGFINSPQKYCFALNYFHGNDSKNYLIQCHVFRCANSHVPSKVVSMLAACFNQYVPKQVCSKQSCGSMSSKEEMTIFKVIFDILEDDGKSHFISVPRDKNGFKLRANVDKKVFISIDQISEIAVCLERCFGLLISPGYNVRQADMHLLDMEPKSSFSSQEQKIFFASANWDSNDTALQLFNEETVKGKSLQFTLAIDMVIQGITEPVRFIIESKLDKPDSAFKILTVESESPKDETGVTRTFPFSNVPSGVIPDANKLSNLPAHISNSDAYETDADYDEPLMSGTGIVSKDCSEDELVSWAEVLVEWKQSLEQRPKRLEYLVTNGIPEALRGEVWQLLTGTQDNQELMDSFKTLILQECNSDEAIEKDLNRTFPGHDYFRESGGIGQDALFKLSKAYAVFDQEVGYCQGLSFLSAALLLHMPEEQSFCVLVHIMYDYGIRDLFFKNFEILHMRLYQLDCLVQEYLQDLWIHFTNLGIESHMFASQWFLTVFTAKFSLFFAFHVLDIFLLHGIDVLFQIALTLLSVNRKELLSLDFEGILNFFRVHLAKRFYNQEAASTLIQTALTVKLKNIKKYEQQYSSLISKPQQDPILNLQTNYQTLLRENTRLDQENDFLVQCLMNFEIRERKYQQHTEALKSDLQSLIHKQQECEDIKRQLEEEVTQIKDMLKREVQKNEKEKKCYISIINEYKQISSRLSYELEQTKTGNFIIKDKENDSILEEREEKNCTLSDSLQSIRELELKLAQTKLDLVEAQCQNQVIQKQQAKLKESC